MRTTLSVATILMSAVAVAQVHAQSAPADTSLVFNPNSVQRAVAPTPAKPAAAPAAKRNKTVQSAPQPRHELPQTTPLATDKPTPQISSATLGRIPFETGSIGLTTDRKYNNSVFSDGRDTPGFENIQTKSPSYFGLSLSVPTDKQRLFPLPLLAPPN